MKTGTPASTMHGHNYISDCNSTFSFPCFYSGERIEDGTTGQRTMNLYSGVTIALMVGMLLLSAAVLKLFLSRTGRWSDLKEHRNSYMTSEFSFPDSSVLTNHV